jgi:hypothetical protein
VLNPYLAFEDCTTNGLRLIYVAENDDPMVKIKILGLIEHPQCYDYEKNYTYYKAHGQHGSQRFARYCSVDKRCQLTRSPM